MNRFVAALLIPVALVPAASAPSAQELLDASVEDLVAREKVRAAVETAIENYLAAQGPARIDVAVEGIRNLLTYGDEIVPYLANELEQDRFDTYDFTAYALGFLSTPAAEKPLREAIERAEATPGAAASARKAYACWALGLHGQIDALKLVNERVHHAARFPMHAQTTLLEAIALQTAPESVPVLLGQLDSWGASDELRGHRRFVLRALRRLADPSSAPRLIKIIDESEEPALRAQAVDALRSIEIPESRAAMLRALEDPVPGVRRAASFGLDWMDYPGDAAKPLELLEKEEDLRTREALYRVVASRVRSEQLTRFFAQWNRPDPEDRRLFIRALSRMDGEGAFPILSSALEDASSQVAMTAVAPLGEMGGQVVVDRLLELLEQTPRWGIVREISKAAGNHGMSQLAPAITRRVIEALQPEVRELPGVYSTVDKGGQALVDLRYTTALAKLRRARESVNDRIMATDLDRTIDLLELLRSNGKTVAKWVPLLRDTDPARGALARSRLAELGDAESLAALVEAYDDSDTLARIDTLQRLEGADTAVVRSLLQRLLLDPDSYQGGRVGERRAASWLARRLGGEEMYELLLQAVHLRYGLDVDNLIYAAALDREKALPLLSEYRLARLRILGQGRGYEQEVLDWIARRLENGRDIERYDQPPSRLVIR